MISKSSSMNRGGQQGRRCFDWMLVCIALLSLALLLPAIGIRDPFFTRLRFALPVALLAYSFGATLVLLYVARRLSVSTDRADAWRKLAIVWLMIVSISVGIFTNSGEAYFQEARGFVHAAANDRRSGIVTKLGRHIVAGYRDPRFIYELIEHDALGGLFITHHNVRGRSSAHIRAEIAGFQSARAKRGQPPLWVTTDQEGGSVSRLSPPLPQQPFLSTLLPADLQHATWDDAPSSEQDGSDLANDSALGCRLFDHGFTQGRALADLGINVNFSPVVDLRFGASEKDDAAMGLLDAFSRIETRAIHRDSGVVSFVAEAYARGLAASGVYPTLKHFPGLGRVAADTHWFAADVPIEPAELENSDWRPFRRVASQNLREALPQSMLAWIMLGHARVPAIDARFDASHSRAIAGRLLRETWNFKGVLITDDFNMRPILLSPGGLGGASVRALNAGLDLLLISYDGENAYLMLAALLKAYQNGELDRGRLAASEGRLQAARAARESAYRKRNACQ